MSASKTTRNSKKKRAAKTEDRYYVLRTAAEARTGLTRKLKAYKRKFITLPLESGKTFVADLKADPRKTVTKLVDDGKTRITDLNKDARTRIDGIKKDGQAFLTKAGKSPRETLGDLMDDGKTRVDDLRSGACEKLDDFKVDFKIFREGVTKDARRAMNDIVDGSKEALNKVPGKQMVEKEVASRVEAIPATFNLPSKKDVERLTRQVKTLNTKVNKLSKSHSA